MNKLMIAAAALVLAGSASAASVMTDKQMDKVTAGWRGNQSQALALGGSYASAHGGNPTAVAVHVNYASAGPGYATAFSGGVAYASSSGGYSNGHDVKPSRH